MPDTLRVAFAAPSFSEPNAETVSGWRLAMLSGAADTLQSLTELDDILIVLLGIAFDLVQPERGVVLLRDPDAGELTLEIAYPEDSEIAVDTVILRRAVDRRETLLAVGTVPDTECADGNGATVCCPLIARNHVLGAIYLEACSGSLAARQEEIGLLNLVSCYAATAIENALLIRESRRTHLLDETDLEPVIAGSAAMRLLRDQIDEVAGRTDPLLITGEPGSGKQFFARWIHVAGRGPDAPFVSLDCAVLEPRDLRVALFGDEDDDGGAWTAAAGGTLVLEHIENLDRLSQKALSGLLHLATIADPGQVSRLVATTDTDLAERVEQHRFTRPLLELIDTAIVAVPPLRERREDILPLARRFLAGRPGLPRRLLSSAERALQVAKFRRANVAELREAVELAVVLADGPEIAAEHVFTGARDRNHRLEVEIGGNRLVRWLLRRRVSAWVQGLIAVFFGGLITACLTVPGEPAGTVANALVWGLWWPALLVLFVLVGRAWCFACPLSRVGRLAQSVWTLGRRPANWLRDHAGWITTGLFLAIVWSEHVFDMPHNPFATGVFLLSLAALAVGFSLVIRREAWCRYACPLGNLSAGFSVPAPVHVHSNPLICTSQCRTHECFKGSESEAGCPMSVHPLYLKDTHFCKLCLSCLRTCPNGSARIFARPPLQDLWSLGELSPTLVPLALTTFLLVPVMLAGTSAPAVRGSVAVYTALALATLGLAAVLQRRMPRWLSGDGSEVASSRVAFALLIVAWGPFMAFHLGHVPGLDELMVEARPGGLGSRVIPAAGMSLLTVLQVAVVGLSCLSGIYAVRQAWKVERHHAARHRSVVWTGVGVVALLYSVGTVLLIL